MKKNRKVNKITSDLIKSHFYNKSSKSFHHIIDIIKWYLNYRFKLAWLFIEYNNITNKYKGWIGSSFKSNNKIILIYKPI